MTVKDAALQAIHRLPDDADYRAIAEEIAFLAALEKGEKDIEEGRVLSNEEVGKRLKSWIQADLDRERHRRSRSDRQVYLRT